MTPKQEAAMRQALDILDSEFTAVDGEFCRWCDGRLSAKHNCKLEQAITAIRAALAEPVEFDHGIGADRFKVVRGAFWWHVLIGDSPTKHGKFGSRADAEKMAATLLREFRNGAFVQHEAALAEPEVEQEPVYAFRRKGVSDDFVTCSKARHDELSSKPRLFETAIFYTAPPHREWVGLTDEERLDFFDDYLARTPDGRHLFRHSWSYAEEEREAFDAGVAAAEAALKEKNA